jgi:hypothetical protein
MNMTSREGIGGRKPGLIDYINVSYNNKEYIIGTIQFKGEDIQFVIDKDDFYKIENRAWHYTSNNYISSSITLNSNRKQLYLHNLVMNRLEHPGKGATETVDHINRNGLDNRKENLRIISQSNQNINQSKKKRSVLLPPGCPINADDIPRHIWYVRANGLHGDRFAIEFKTEGLVWKSTSSKAISIQEKLKQAREKLQEFYIQYPHLNPVNTDKIQEIHMLNDSYNSILRLTQATNTDSHANSQTLLVPD